MALTGYRPGQGIYARATAGGAGLLVSLFGSWRLFLMLNDPGAAPREVLGVPISASALWAGGLFIVLAAVIAVVTFGLKTGLEPLDRRIRSLIDLLVDTQAELAKVSWPGKDELTRSTTAVLISIAVLGLFLFAVDYLLGLVWRFLFI